MKNSFLTLFIVATVAFFPFLSAEGNEPPSQHPQRGYQLGFTSNLLTGIETTGNFENISKAGFGLAGVYEFIITPRFSLGVDLQYRMNSGPKSISQLGYGLLMKHYLAEERNLGSPSPRPYLEYGLLLNVNRQKNRPHSGTAHDTKLALGIDWNSFETPLYGEVSYHISRLTYFEADSINLDYFQINFGWRGTLL